MVLFCGRRGVPAKQFILLVVKVAKYYPIQGELLGVTWALEETSYYMLGCDQLLVLVDRKLLLGLLANRELVDISNPRL